MTAARTRAVSVVAEVLCRRDDSMYHHERTDDFPCWACLADAEAVVAALEAAGIVAWQEAAA